MNDAPEQDVNTSESVLVEIIDEFNQRLARGEHPLIEEYARRYPDLSQSVRKALSALEMLRALNPESSSAGRVPLAEDSPEGEPGAVGQLGDYRIIREVGRGGMGVVYEAEQISLGRRVALKVLPFAAVLDNRQLQRFKNEAQAAAQLHHTNILPVYGVGCERGVHFYAMQFVDGPTLADAIRELRDGSGVNDESEPRAPASGFSVAERGVRDAEWGVQDDAGSSAAHAFPLTGALSILSADGSTKNPAFFRSVATLGVQAAEALERAHARGIVHRDIKPSNLLIETQDNQTHLWVTDFGLAKVLEEVRGATTLVSGTPYYMSPEQVLGEKVDHRSDLYSLGVTLFELATGGVPFDSGEIG